MVYTGLKFKDHNNKILSKYFKSKDEWKRLDALYNERLMSKDSAVQFELDLLENEIQILLSKEEYTQSEKEMIDRIKEYYSSRFPKHEYLFASSPIYNESFCIDKIFDENQKKLIETEKSSLIDVINEYIDIYINSRGENLALNEKQLMFSYLSSDCVNIGDIDTRRTIEKIIEIILSEGKINDYYEVKFLLDYVNRKQCYALEYERCKLYLDYQLPRLNNYGNVEKEEFYIKCTARGVSNNGIIGINTACIDPNKLNDFCMNSKDLYEYIDTVAHESMHYKQLIDRFNDIYTYEGFAEMINELIYSNSDFYYTNYFFDPTEYQAFVRGKEMAIDYIKKFKKGDELEKKWRDALETMHFRNAYAMNIPTSNDAGVSPIISDKFLVNKLAELCKNNPKLIQKYKILRLFFRFDLSGQSVPSNLSELIANFETLESQVRQYKFDYKCDYAKMFMPFFTIALDNYDLESTKENNVKNAKIQRILIMVVRNEANQLVLMTKGIDYFAFFELTLTDRDKRFKGNQEKMALERLRRIRKFLPYIKSEDEVNRINAILNPILPNIGALEKRGSMR